MKIQVLLSPGCAHGHRAVDAVAEVARQAAPGARVETIVITTLEEAELWGFKGSPTVLVDGVDVDPDAPRGVGLG